MKTLEKAAGGQFFPHVTAGPVPLLGTFGVCRGWVKRAPRLLVMHLLRDFH